MASGLLAAEARVEFIATVNGRRVPGAEVCFFRAGVGNPLEKFAASQDVRCLPADQVIAITPGRWVHFLRHRGKKLIATTPSMLNVPAEPPPTDVFHQFQAELAPAGVLDLSRVNAALRPDDRLALYVANENTPVLPMIIPIPRGESSVLAPAGDHLLLLLLQHSRVLNVSEPITIAQGARHEAPLFPKLTENDGNVLTWIEFPEEARHRPLEDGARIPAVGVELDAGSDLRRPILPVRNGFGSEDALLFFRGVPFGRHTIKVSSAVWTPADVKIEVERPGITVAAQGVVTQPAAALTVEWSVKGAPPPLDPSGCEAAEPNASKSAVTTTSARLYVCEGLQPAQSPNSVDRRKCRVAAEPVSLEPRARRAVFAGVRPSSYLIAVQEPDFPPKYEIATLAMGEHARSALTFEPFNVLGRVTMDGVPLQARLEFATGVVVSGADGYYVGSLKSKPWSRRVGVVRCADGKTVATHVASKPIEAGVAHDIAIVSTELRAAVLDAETGRPIPKSYVDVSARVDDGDNSLFGPVVTDADGHAILRNVPVDEPLVICAAASQYEHTCIEPFVLGDESRRSVQIRLSPKLHAGRLLTDHRFSWGKVSFVAPNGAVVEEANVRADGTFDFRYPHAAPEYVVVASDLPLFVLPLGAAPAEPLGIPISSLPARTIEISIAPQSTKRDALVALFIDGRYIPQHSQQLHLGMRGMQNMIVGRGPLRIPDLAASDVRIGLGPTLADLPPDTVIPDFFLRPEYASQLLTKQVDASNRVVFAPKN